MISVGVTQPRDNTEPPSLYTFPPPLRKGRGNDKFRACGERFSHCFPSMTVPAPISISGNSFTAKLMASAAPIRSESDFRTADTVFPQSGKNFSRIRQLFDNYDGDSFFHWSAPFPP